MNEPSSHSDDPAQGRELKEEAFLRLGRRESLIRAARRALLVSLLSQHPSDSRVTADDVRDRVELPQDVNPSVFGVVPGSLAKANIIEAIGYRESRRPDAHARAVRVWRLKDRDAALAWLKTHPEIQPKTSLEK